MMKTAGIILISVNIVLYGVTRIINIHRKCEILRKSIEMLTCLSDMLDNSVLSDCFDEMCSFRQFQNFEFLQILRDCMKKGMSPDESISVALSEENDLSNKAKSAFESLECILGRFDSETQLRAIKSSIKILESEYDKEILKSEKNLPVVKTLSICTAAIAAIIFI